LISKCLYDWGAYVGVLFSWSLEGCKSLDRLFAPEIRKRFKISAPLKPKTCSNLRLSGAQGINGGVVSGNFWRSARHCVISHAHIISSSGRASHSSSVPAAQSSLSTLPTTVEVYRVTSFLPPSYVGAVSPEPRLSSLVPQLPYFGDALTGDSHVYISPQTTTGYSPLPQAVNHEAFRISVSLLATRDHRHWTSTLVHDCIPKYMPRPTAQTLLLTGILRALGDHQAMVDDSKLKTFCSDQSLTRSLKSPPSTHSNKVLD